MVKSIEKLFNIREIKKASIITRENRELYFFIIKSLSGNNKYENLTLLLASFEKQIQLIFCRRNLDFTDFESYFSKMLTDNLFTPFLPEVLAFIENFKKQSNSFAVVSPYLVIELEKDETTAQLIELFQRQSISLQVLNGDEITELIERMCLL